MSKKTANPPAERGKPKTPEQRAKLTKLLADGEPVGEALKAVGYGASQVKKGWDAVPKAVKDKLTEKGKRLIEFGAFSKDTRKALVRGRLIENVTNGRDGGAMSAKILGSDSELNMWTPDFQTGVIVLNAPQGLAERKAELLKDCESVPEEGQR